MTSSRAASSLPSLVTNVGASTTPPSVAGGVLVAVTGASGGLGASVLTAALAVRAVAAGRTACVVDLDPLGGGLDIVLGLEQTDGTRWGDLAALEGEADGESVLHTLPRADGVRVLSHDRHGTGVPDTVVRALVDALVLVCDLVVLDLPRPGRLPVGSPPADHHLILAGTTLTHVAALSALLTSMAPAHPAAGPPTGRDGGPTVRAGPVGPVGTVAVLLRGGGAGGADPARMAPVVLRQLGAKVLGVIPDDRSVPADLAHGLPPGGRSGPLAKALDPLLLEVLQSRWAGAA